MSNIPDQMSMKDLKSFMETAAKDKAGEPTFDSKSIEEVVTIAKKYIDASVEECSSPMVHKAMVLIILQYFMDFHRAGAEFALTQERNTELAGMWMSDHGKLLAAAEAIISVNITGFDLAPEDIG